MSRPPDPQTPPGGTARSPSFSPSAPVGVVFPDEGKRYGGGCREQVRIAFLKTTPFARAATPNSAERARIDPAFPAVPLCLPFNPTDGLLC
ncbi:hypothetical protein [Azospirillum largimobile]